MSITRAAENTHPPPLTPRPFLLGLPIKGLPIRRDGADGIMCLALIECIQRALAPDKVFEETRSDCIDVFTHAVGHPYFTKSVLRRMEVGE